MRVSRVLSPTPIAGRQDERQSEVRGAERRVLSIEAVGFEDSVQQHVVGAARPLEERIHCQRGSVLGL